jgi:hypothetical protein
MCATCVAQGAPYVVGSLVALRVMASTSRRRLGGPRDTGAFEPVQSVAVTGPDGQR